MTGRQSKRGFASRPGDAESWIKAPDMPIGIPAKADAFTARLTIDVMPDLRGRRDGPGCLDSFPRTISGVLPGLVSLPYRAWDGGRA
jgi:hypothetical protein